MNRYNPQSIEKKWQDLWQQENAFQPQNTPQDKWYVLDMFPYPSGAGLHVGHPEGYTATDIFSRYKRMCGSDVLHPMGWDAFGLPAENYAIKTGVHPAQSTAQNIDTFKRQIRSLGFSYDWNREINTSSPEYYKWTQWLFVQLYEAGLVYRKNAKVNWCNTCQTVLANEQVIDGNCERSKDPVIQKELEQWFFKITAYAEELLADLEGLDWPEPIKLMQRNWIGKSEGAEIDFSIQNYDEQITVFTTRPDTLYGATYMVLAPEHPLIENITTQEQKSAVAEYQKSTQQKNDLERASLNKKKTGVFTGAYAINPGTKTPIPIWIADYVLMTYGTGAIMAVPAHDERDAEFAAQFDLPVIESEGTPWDQIAACGGRQKITYRLRDWLISRQRYWGAPIPMVYDPEGTPHPVKEEHLPLLLPTDVDYTPKGTSPLGSSEKYHALAEELYGTGWRFEVDTMDTFVCSSWYYLRYVDPQNTEQFASTEALREWLPVDMYVGGAEHAVLHLLYARFFHKALQDCGVIPKEVGREPFVRLRNQGMILGEDHQKMSKSVGNVINPDDVIAAYGADTLRLYEMFMGPFEDVKPWNTDSIKGVYRFLNRVWDLVIEHKDLPESSLPSKRIHKTIQKVTQDIEGFRFNTAISEMMECLNTRDFVNTKNVQAKGEIVTVDRSALKKLLLVLHPFAPHITAELWEQMGENSRIDEQEWPTYDPSAIQEESIAIGVQVNGKVRDTIEITPDTTEEQAQAMALASHSVQKHIAGKQIVKCIYVPKKIVSIVITQ